MTPSELLYNVNLVRDWLPITLSYLHSDSLKDYEKIAIFLGCKKFLEKPPLHYYYYFKDDKGNTIVHHKFLIPVKLWTISQWIYHPDQEFVMDADLTAADFFELSVPEIKKYLEKIKTKQISPKSILELYDSNIEKFSADVIHQNIAHNTLIILNDKEQKLRLNQLILREQNFNKNIYNVSSSVSYLDGKYENGFLW